MLVYKKTVIYLHREQSRIGKNMPVCLCARTYQALRTLITRKILRSKDGQCN